ncbi:MAG: type I phosphomannose isomerase catalytic subunit [Candidatus Methanospirareceae archaeon]
MIGFGDRERETWEAYYKRRVEIREAIKRMKEGFIKPRKDNLVETVWGGDKIGRLKGLAISQRRIGEAWECSAHPQRPSLVKINDFEMPLHHILSMIGKEVLGEVVAREYRGMLPVLVKFIDAQDNLSVQVHPSDEAVKEMGEVEEFGKDEAWFVLEAEEDAKLYIGFKEDVEEETFIKDLSSPAVNIAEKYLNVIKPKRGEVFFNPAGTIHAIGKGLFLVEVQQSSGLTYRIWDWNRTGRALHIEKARRVLNFNRSERGDFERSAERISDKEERLVSSLHFSIDKINLPQGDELLVETKGSFHVLTCIEGEVELRSEKSKEKLCKGESILVPASLGKYKMVAMKNTQILKSFVLTPQQINPVIFQTYDVRAIADKDIPDKVAFYLGKGYGTYIRRINNAEAGELNVVVGGGIRLSTPRIKKALIKGLLSAGVNVYDIGISSTPELYFAIPFLDADGGINVTASHNEAEYNGLKQVIKDRDGFITSISAKQMLELKELILKGDFLDGEGKYVKIEEGEIARYHNELVKANVRLGRDIWVYLKEKWSKRKNGLRELLDKLATIEFPEEKNEKEWARIREMLELPEEFEQPETAIKHPFKDLKLVIDFGNGSTWRTKDVYTDLGAEVVALNEEPDGSFPAHVPDPIKAKYRRQLEEKVKEVAREEEERARRVKGYKKKEVVGFGHDEDGDRVIYVRSDGKVVEGDRTLAIQAKRIIEEHRRKGKEGKPRFIGEVKFSRIAEEFITSHGGEYIMSPTGFAFIKEGTKKIYKALKEGLKEVELFGRKIDLSRNKQPVILAAELSGHQMSGHEENWIFDDATLAAAKVLSVIALSLKEGKNFIQLDEEVPRYPVSPEINIRLPTNVLSEKQEVVDKVVEIFKKKGYPIDTTDGGLIKWEDEEGRWIGQALVRKSNTQPMLICRVEGRDEGSKERIEEEFFEVLARVSTKAVPKLDLASDDYVRYLLDKKLSG